MLNLFSFFFVGLMLYNISWCILQWTPLITHWEEAPYCRHVSKSMFSIILEMYLDIPELSVNVVMVLCIVFRQCPEHRHRTKFISINLYVEITCDVHTHKLWCGFQMPCMYYCYIGVFVTCFTPGVLFFCVCICFCPAASRHVHTYWYFAM